MSTGSVRHPEKCTCYYHATSPAGQACLPILLLKALRGPSIATCCNLSDLCSQSCKIPLDQGTHLKLCRLGKSGVFTWPCHLMWRHVLSPVVTVKKWRTSSSGAGLPSSPKKTKCAHNVHARYSEINGSAHTRSVQRICTANASLRH